MREIKIKVKRKILDVYDRYIETRWEIFTIEEGIMDIDNCLMETAGEYTGLKDKNGVEIYDKDNVLLNGKKGVIIIDEKGTSIKWRDSEFVEITDYLYKMCDTYDFDIEVIGNIHQ